MNHLTKLFLVLNDKLISSDDPLISSMNPSLIIYEVIRIINGKCLFLEDHLNRLYDSINETNLQLNLNQNEVIKNIFKLVSSNSLINGNIRIDVCVEEKEIYLLSQIIPHNYPSSDDYLKGVIAITYKGERDNPNAKILNSDFRARVNKIIVESNAWEALLINHQNNITEGSKSNIFAIKGKIVFTPPTQKVLPGITRKHVIDICKKLDIKLIEHDISYAEISRYDSFFITGTSPKILPLKMIDDIYFKISSNILKNIMLEYDKIILCYIEKTNIPVV
jgi:branched-chain amino acid aminotransferase